MLISVDILKVNFFGNVRKHFKKKYKLSIVSHFKIQRRKSEKVTSKERI